MAALGDHGAVVEERDAVGVVQPQGRDARDHGRTTAAGVGDAGRDAGLGVGVDRGGRLDQDEDGCVGGHGAGEHHPLALAAGQAAAALVELALPALGQRVVDVLGAGDPQRLLGLPPGQPGVRVDGVLEGAGEELARRVADQHLTSYVVEAGVGEVDAAEA